MPEPPQPPSANRQVPAPSTNADPHNRQARWLLLICIVLWIGLLAVGLWPFDFFARNRVQWIAEGSGLRIERQGQIYASVPWAATPAAPGTESFTVELWLRSRKACDCLGTILSWYDPSRPRHLEIQQSVRDLVVRGNFQDAHRSAGYRSLWLDEALQDDRPRFLTVTSGPLGTVLFLEGVRSRSYPYAAAGNNLAGRLVLGHSTEGRSAWAGDILGLAIYQHALSPEEVFRNYEFWNAGKTAELESRKGILGFYLFDRNSGEMIRNRGGSMPDLMIPRRFSVFRKPPLVCCQNWHKSDVKDAIVNIGGFVPFGLFVSAYLQWGLLLPKRRAIIVAIIVGAFTSLLIELLQVYLPSRDSSFLDLINNAVGSAVGAAMLAWLMTRLHGDWRAA